MTDNLSTSDMKKNNTTSGSLDLSDINCVTPPEGWSPEVVDAAPDPADIRDLDEEASE